MAVRISKDSVNIREKLAQLERPIGVNGAALMATNTPQDAFSLINAGRKNVIINGDMIINQRGIVGGSNNAGVSRAAGFGLDRWTVWRANDGVNGGVIQEQSTDVPTGQYFKNSLKLTINGTGNPTASTSVRLLLHQMIEGNNMYQLRYGTSGARYFTFSFWVKCSVTGIYAVAFTNNNGDRGYVATYNINSASTWEYKTITVPGDTTGTWTNDNTAGLTINFDLGVNGPTTSTYNTWLSGDYRGGTTTTKLNANNGATYFITGVQLEEGKIATPFEYRSFGQELALCQRYCHKWGGDGTASSQYSRWPMGTWVSTSQIILGIPHPVSMRTALKTLTVKATSGIEIYSQGLTFATPTYGFNTDGATLDFTNINISGLSGGTAYAVMAGRFINDNTAYFLFSAEL